MKRKAIREQYFGNCRLKVNIINKLIEKRATSYEIDFILYASLYQDNLGRVKIYYKEVCSAIGISKTHYYDMIESLIEKDIITVNYDPETCKPYWDITINDNEFIYKDDYSSYLKTNRDILFSTEYRKMKRNIKLLVLRLLVVNRESEYKKFKDSTLMEWLDIKSERTLKEYIRELEVFFEIKFLKKSITMKESDLYLFQFKKSMDYARKSEMEHYLGYKIKYICKKYNVNKVRVKDKETNSYVMRELDETAINDVITLFKQYKNTNKVILALCDTMFLKYDSDGTELEPALSPQHINYKINTWNYRNNCEDRKSYGKHKGRKSS